MRLENHTHWDGQAIKRLVRRVAQDEFDAMPQPYTVTVKYKRRSWAGCGTLGRAPYGLSALQPARRMTLYLERDVIDSVQVAKTIAHEFGHNKGIRHRDMKNTRYGWVDGWRDRYAWAAEFSIGPAPAKPVMAPVTVLERKLAHVEARRKQAETRAKRAQTLLKKWARKQRYYESKLAALKSAPSRA